jgi:hypothetical protein
LNRSSICGLRTGSSRPEPPVEPAAFEELGDLLETALTRYATIAQPESLARILAWQARQAKADLPARFSEAVRDLLLGVGPGVPHVGAHPIEPPEHDLPRSERTPGKYPLGQSM